MVNGGRWKKQGLSRPPRVRKVLGEWERGGQDGGWRWGETRTGAGCGAGSRCGFTVRSGAPGSGLGTPPPNPRGEQCGLCGCRAGRRDPSLGWKGAGREVGRGVPGCRLTLSILVPRGMGRTEPNPQAALRPLLPPSRSFRLFPRSRRRRPQHGHPGPAAPRSAPAPPAAAERVPRGARPAPPHPTAAQRRSRSETAGDAAPHRGAARRIRL